MSNKKPIYKWISFPLLNFPYRQLSFLLFLLFSSSICLHDYTKFLLGSTFYGFPFSSLFSFFVPTYYKFYDDHVFVKLLVFKRERKYNEFKCFYADKKGVMLSTFNRPRGLDRFRGQSIRFTKAQDEREQINGIF